MKLLALRIMLIVTLCSTMQIVHTSHQENSDEKTKSAMSILITRSGDSSQKAKIKYGTIKGATHYELTYEGSREELNSKNESVYVKYGLAASFYGYDFTKKEVICLGKVEIENFDEENLKKLNSFLDPESKLPIIASAKIGNCFKVGRYVNFFDENEKLIECSHHYCGPIDLKSAEAQNNRTLIQPPALLENLKKVTEIKHRHILSILRLFLGPTYEVIHTY